MIRMDKETERLAPPSTYELLIRLDERQSVIIESFKDVKDEIQSIKIDFRAAQERVRDELMKSIDDRTGPLMVRLAALENEVDTLKTCVATASGGASWTRSAFEILMAIIMLYIAIMASI